jgi:hypothetical protein
MDEDWWKVNNRYNFLSEIMTNDTRSQLARSAFLMKTIMTVEGGFGNPSRTALNLSLLIYSIYTPWGRVVRFQKTAAEDGQT